MKEKKSFDWFGFTGMILGTIAVFISLTKQEPISWDIAGTLVGVLGLLTAILIAWQVKSVIDYANEKKDLLATIEGLNKELKQQKIDSEKYTENLRVETQRSVFTMNSLTADLYLKSKDYQFSLHLFLATSKDWALDKPHYGSLLDRILTAIESNEYVLNDFDKETVLKSISDINGELISKMKGLSKLIEYAMG